MAHIPDYAVVGSVKHIVEGHSELHRAHRRGEMAGVDAHLGNEEAPYVGTQSFELIEIHASDIGGP